jgi:hypothetical protein
MNIQGKRKRIEKKEAEKKGNFYAVILILFIIIIIIIQFNSCLFAWKLNGSEAKFKVSTREK